MATENCTLQVAGHGQALHDSPRIATQPGAGIAGCHAVGGAPRWRETSSLIWDLQGLPGTDVGGEDRGRVRAVSGTSGPMPSVDRKDSDPSTLRTACPHDRPRCRHRQSDWTDHTAPPLPGVPAHPRRGLPAFGAVGEKHRRERPHRRDCRRCALRLRRDEQRPRHVPCVLDRQRVERAERPFHDGVVAAPVHDPCLASVRSYPQSEPRRGAVPQDGLAPVRGRKGARWPPS